MELISSPTYTEQPVLFVDIIFADGHRDQLTIKAVDRFDASPEFIQVTIADPAEAISYNMRHVVGIRTRKGVLQTPIKKEKP